LILKRVEAAVAMGLKAELTVPFFLTIKKEAFRKGPTAIVLDHLERCIAGLDQQEAGAVKGLHRPTFRDLGGDP